MSDEIREMEEQEELGQAVADGEHLEEESLPEVEPIDAGAVTFVMQNELGEEVLVNLPTIMTRLFQDMAGFYNELETLKAKVEGKEGRIIVPD